MVKQFNQGGGGLNQILGLAQTGLGIATGNPALLMSGLSSTMQGTELDGLSPLMGIMGAFGGNGMQKKPMTGRGPAPQSAGFMAGY